MIFQSENSFHHPCETSMTVQATDLLLVRGQYLSMQEFPLTPYLARLPKRLRPVIAERSTANWRGHIAFWEIRDGMLWLIDVEARILVDGDVVDATLETFLPHRKGPIAATWFTDDLRCPDGRLRSFRLVHGIGQPDRERVRGFSICKGRVEDEWVAYLPPSPLFYRLHPDGRREHVAGYNGPYGWFPKIEALDDPFAPDAPVEPWRLWGDPDYDIVPYEEFPWDDGETWWKGVRLA